MVITFLGHSTITNSSELLEKMVKTILENTRKDEKISFYCGGYGDFDNLSAKACRLIKKQRPNSEVVLVTPYLKNLTKNDIYDATIYPPIENVLPRYAIIKRNEWMVERADLIIAYVKYTYGGAYKTLNYAERKKKPIINLASSL